MQRVFLLRHDVQAEVPVFLNPESNEWEFVLPEVVTRDLSDVLNFLSAQRRYNTRQVPDATSLYTWTVVEGEMAAMPWLDFLQVEEEIAENLMTAFECSICAEGFPFYADNFEGLHPTDQCLVASPCGEGHHMVCTVCLRKMLLNFYNHPATPATPFLRCVFPDCPSMEPISKDWTNIFTEEEQRQIHDHLAKVGVPETLHTTCIDCEEVIVSPLLEGYKNSERVVLSCQACRAKHCWHCEEKEDKCVCTLNLPFVFSRHMNRYMNGVRNYLLTQDMIQKKIQSIVQGGDKTPMVMECAKCGAHITKSVSCCEMAHCGVKWCYCCGRMTLPNETVLIDHFGHICPRYESQLFWHKLGATNYRCTEGQCYDEGTECTVRAHSKGLREKHLWHKFRWLCCLIHSLPQHFLQDTYNFIKLQADENPIASLFLQKVRRNSTV